MWYMFIQETNISWPSQGECWNYLMEEIRREKEKIPVSFLLDVTSYGLESSWYRFHWWHVFSLWDDIWWIWQHTPCLCFSLYTSSQPQTSLKLKRIIILYFKSNFYSVNDDHDATTNASESKNLFSHFKMCWEAELNPWPWDNAGVTKQFIHSFVFIKLL